MSETAAPVCPNYLGGKWITPSGKSSSNVFNPSRGSVIATVPMCGQEEVDAVVASAKAAFPDWRDTPPNERAQVLFRAKIMLEEAFEELCLGIATEHGKTLSEARGDLRRGIEVVEYACGVPTLLMGESLENIARGIDCHTDRHPLGVVAGICPFNFPALVPMWMWPLAIACGNTFVLKPSEKVPAHDAACRRHPGESRSASRRDEHRPWRARMRRCHPRASGCESRQLRRLHPRRPGNPPQGHLPRKARPGRRWSEKFHHPHARRRYRPHRRGRERRCLRLRR